eukprot:TRINITY_DN1910_c0_g1_i1.p1 TRINITY_DN1910_c0_g1~~TRINITY_DN1910_c0_g1_i1.p1  ORF type:complete len:257 (+),score=20.09 TRINITY_DN1910_c0_g1_i1:76-846(+)
MLMMFMSPDDLKAPRFEFLEGMSYLPMVAQLEMFWWGLLFHTAVGLIPRAFALYMWPSNSPYHLRKRDVVGRYTPSLVHAFVSAFWNWIVPPQYSAGYINLMFNSGGYFIADMVIDHDPDYIIHHLAPLFWGECLMRTNTVFFYSILCIRTVELGNVFAHTAAIATNRSGKLFHRVNTLSFWISRPLSMIPGFLAWTHDIPDEDRFGFWGLMVLLCFVVTFYINGKWMIKMITPRPKDLNNKTKPNHEKAEKHKKN